MWIGDNKCTVCELWNIIEEIAVKVHHAMPYHPDPSVNRYRAARSPATIMINAEVLKDYVTSYEKEIAVLKERLKEYEPNDGSE